MLAKSVFHLSRGALKWITDYKCRTCKKRKAVKKSTIGKAVSERLCAFVDDASVLSQEDKDAILEPLADWV